MGRRRRRTSSFIKIDRIFLTSLVWGRVTPWMIGWRDRLQSWMTTPPDWSELVQGRDRQGRRGESCPQHCSSLLVCRLRCAEAAEHCHETLETHPWSPWSWCCPRWSCCTDRCCPPGGAGWAPWPWSCCDTPPWTPGSTCHCSVQVSTWSLSWNKWLVRTVWLVVIGLSCDWSWDVIGHEMWLFVIGHEMWLVSIIWCLYLGLRWSGSLMATSLRAASSASQSPSPGSTFSLAELNWSESWIKWIKMNKNE